MCYTTTLTAVPGTNSRFMNWDGLPTGVGDMYSATVTLPLNQPYRAARMRRRGRSKPAIALSVNSGSAISTRMGFLVL